jgi:hypothetical protein
MMDLLSIRLLWERIGFVGYWFPEERRAEPLSFIGAGMDSYGGWVAA